MQMRGPAALIALLALAACSDQDPTQSGTSGREPAPYYAGAEGAAIEGQYLVVLDEGASAEPILRAARVQPQRSYSELLNGFSARLSRGQLESIRQMEGVAFVEQDQVFRKSAMDSILIPGMWGLDRVDQRALPLSRTYNYTKTGTGVNVYIVDSGIRYTHQEFTNPGGPRAHFAYDAFGGNGSDCDGHGTHVAGTAAGYYSGIAFTANVHSVKVLDCNGNGTTSGVVAALTWLRTNRVRPAVANLSLGGPLSKAVNVAVDGLFQYGVFPVVAAGNDGQYSCNYSPASAVRAYTVAASDSTDLRAPFSNWGRCVSIYAPGVFVVSSWHTSDAMYNWLSGTSMAAPHVTGVVAQYLQGNPTASMGTVANWLTKNATTGVIRYNDSGSVMYGTPNLLLYNDRL